MSLSSYATGMVSAMYHQITKAATEAAIWTMDKNVVRQDIMYVCVLVLPSKLLDNNDGQQRTLQYGKMNTRHPHLVTK